MFSRDPEDLRNEPTLRIYHDKQTQRNPVHWRYLESRPTSLAAQKQPGGRIHEALWPAYIGLV